MDDADLILHLTEYYEDEGSTGFNILDFVGAFGSPLLAIAYSKLFWPKFVEFEGMVFLANDSKLAQLAENTKSDILECLAKDSSKKQAVERAFNLFEIPSYFFNANAGDTYDEEDKYLAQTLAMMWENKLSTDFPSRSFQVEVIDSEDSGGEVALTFYHR